MNTSDFNKTFDSRSELLARSRVLIEEAHGLARTHSLVQRSLEKSLLRLHEVEEALEDLIREATALQEP